MNKENKQRGSLLSGQEPHQKQDLEQAVRASEAAFNLETEKGISPDPGQYNNGGENGNIRHASRDNKQVDKPGDLGAELDQVRENTDLDATEYDLTSEDLQRLDTAEDLDDQEDFPGHS